MILTIRNFLTHATPAQRCLLVVWLNTPFLLAFMAVHSAGLLVDEWRTLLVPKYMILANMILGVVLLIEWVVVAWLWRRRHRNDALPKTYVLLASIIGIAFACEAFLTGNLTYPTNMVIVGVIPIGLLILDMRSVSIAMVVGLSFYWANDLAIYTGWIDYAPGYSPNAFAGGEHHFMAEMFRTGVLYTSVAAYGAIAWVLLDQYDYHRNTLTTLAKLDALTGLSNRRYFFQRLDEEYERQKRTSQPLCLVMMDADHFKRINDSYGHLMGDAVLRGIADVLSRHMRVPADLPARIGGEEFAILLPDTELAGARKVCERVERSLQSTPFFSNGKRFTVTLSMGVVESRDLYPENLLHYADANLYKAKAQGRDTVVASVEEEVLPHARMASMA
jgi:diguanylate cyclase (GGDEF)-like protein